VAEICSAIPCIACVSNAGMRNLELPRTEEQKVSSGLFYGLQLACFANVGVRNVVLPRSEEQTAKNAAIKLKLPVQWNPLKHLT
jgi:hypothetical protein